MLKLLVFVIKKRAVCNHLNGWYCYLRQHETNFSTGPKFLQIFILKGFVTQPSSSVFCIGSLLSVFPRTGWEGYKEERAKRDSNTGYLRASPDQLGLIQWKTNKFKKKFFFKLSYRQYNKYRYRKTTTMLDGKEPFWTGIQSHPLSPIGSSHIWLLPWPYTVAAWLPGWVFLLWLALLAASVISKSASCDHMQLQEEGRWAILPQGF